MRLLLIWLINTVALFAIPQLLESVQIDSFSTALLALISTLWLVWFRLSTALLLRLLIRLVSLLLLVIWLASLLILITLLLIIRVVS